MRWPRPSQVLHTTLRPAPSCKHLLPPRSRCCCCARLWRHRRSDGWWRWTSAPRGQSCCCVRMTSVGCGAIKVKWNFIEHVWCLMMNTSKLIGRRLDCRLTASVKKVIASRADTPSPSRTCDLVWMSRVTSRLRSDVTTRNSMTSWTFYHWVGINKDFRGVE